MKSHELVGPISELKPNQNIWQIIKIRVSAQRFIIHSSRGMKKIIEAKGDKFTE